MPCYAMLPYLTSTSAGSAFAHSTALWRAAYGVLSAPRSVLGTSAIPLCPPSCIPQSRFCSRPERLPAAARNETEHKSLLPRHPHPRSNPLVVFSSYFRSNSVFYFLSLWVLETMPDWSSFSTSPTFPSPVYRGSEEG